MHKSLPHLLATSVFTITTGAVLAWGQGLPANAVRQGRVISPNAPVAPSALPVDAPAPGAAPCTVTLFNNYEFSQYSAQYFNYTPSCPGPWSKVTFEGSFNVTEGIQFDRTANIQLGYVNIYFGTTEEPSPTSGPSWKVERDLTDYSSLFATAQSGEVDIYNIVSPPYTGIIYGTATLKFYPVAAGGTPPVVADAVYPLPDGPGAPYQLSSPASQLAVTFTLPTNIERAYLDVVSQGQQTDEFWYTCVPDDLTTELESCGSTAFRETEISIDGQSAGVAPIYPWIFTGGIDPYLWIPIPGEQTLNFVPYRVDLTPFAGLLSNGQPHTIALGVYNADNYFQSVATLLVYLDHGSTQVTGGILTNTIGMANPAVLENLTTTPQGGVYGTVTTTSARNFQLEGYVNTSHGQVVTLVSQKVDFANSQQFIVSDSRYTQNITQGTTVASTTSTTSLAGTETIVANYSFPLIVDISETLNEQGIQLLTSISQTYDTTTQSGSNTTVVADEVKTTDTLQLDDSGDILGNSNQKSSETNSTTVNGTCTGSKTLAANNQYVGRTTGCQ